jgi:hypothetical protein
LKIGIDEIMDEKNHFENLYKKKFNDLKYTQLEKVNALNFKLKSTEKKLKKYRSAYQKLAEKSSIQKIEKMFLRDQVNNCLKQ